MNTSRGGEDRQLLAELIEEKDLGVWTTNKTKSERQCLAAANNATSALRILELSFQHLKATKLVPRLRNKYSERLKVICLNLYSLEQRRI